MLKGNQKGFMRALSGKHRKALLSIKLHGKNMKKVKKGRPLLNLQKKPIGRLLHMCRSRKDILKVKSSSRLERNILEKSARAACRNLFQKNLRKRHHAVIENTPPVLRALKEVPDGSKCKQMQLRIFTRILQDHCRLMRK